MKIEVTQNDIDNGHTLKCPIHLATIRAINAKEDDSISVGYRTISISLNEEDCCGDFLLPAEAKDFVRNFDEGKSVQPFSFEISGDLIHVKDENNYEGSLIETVIRSI